MPTVSPNWERRDAGTLSPGDLEFIALNSDIDGDEEFQTSVNDQSLVAACRPSTWNPHRRIWVSLTTAGLGLLAIAVVMMLFSQEAEENHDLHKVSSGSEIQEWQADSSKILVNQRQDSGPGQTLAGHDKAWAHEKTTREKAAASWDLSSLPCRCNCQTPPPRLPSEDQIIQSASDARKHRAVKLAGGFAGFFNF
jgi:hypothetical protein